MVAGAWWIGSSRVGLFFGLGRGAEACDSTESLVSNARSYHGLHGSHGFFYIRAICVIRGERQRALLTWESIGIGS